MLSSTLPKPDRKVNGFSRPSPGGSRKFKVYRLIKILYKYFDRPLLKAGSRVRRSSKILPPGVPDCLKKRRLLNEPQLSPALCREYGEKFLALGWWEDALEFFQKGQDAEGLEKLRTQALQTGDVFLLARLGKNPHPELWLQVAHQALETGRLHFARRAFELAGDQERAAALAERIKEDHPAS
jgi:hypothetical protein